MKVSAVNLLAAAIVVAASACTGEKSRGPDTAAAKPAVTSYVGYGYDPVPEGVSLVSASEIVEPDGKPTHFVLTHVITPLGNTMWLDSLLPSDGQVRRRIVRAELLVNVERGNRLIISTCDVNKKLDPAVVAMVRDSADANGKYSAIVHAWRANPREAKFDTLAGTDVVCDEPNAR
jgi:hypothetical protein